MSNVPYELEKKIDTQGSEPKGRVHPPQAVSDAFDVRDSVTAIVIRAADVDPSGEQSSNGGSM